MLLTLSITSYQKLTPGIEAVRTLAEGSLSIGRAPTNDWVLPDPDLVISGRHCVIQAHSGDYYVTDTSTNGVFIGGRRVGRGNSQQLRSGDVLTLGDFEIQANLGPAAATAPPAHDPFAGLGAPAGTGTAADPFANLAPAADPFAGLGARPGGDPLAGLAPTPAADPFADLFGSPAGTPAVDPLGLGPAAGGPHDFGLFDVPRKPAPGPATPADHLPSEQQAFVPPQSMIPDDWDDLLGPSPGVRPDAGAGAATPTLTPAPEQSAAPPPPGTADVPGSPLPAANADDPFGIFSLPPADAGAPVSDATPTPAPVLPTAGGAADDLFAAARTPTPRPAPPTADAVPSEPTPVPSFAVAAPPAADTAAMGGAIAAFLAGAGLAHVQISGDQAVPLMHALGQSYRLMVQGLIDVLRARASMKGEFRLTQTTIRPIENNPLKFAPNVEEAMALLLTQRSNVYLPPERAIGEAFQDLKVHQVAMMAGMQAALTLLLKRFDPATLEARLGDGDGGGLGGLFGGNRKARNWEQFTLLYQEIAREAEDDFQDLFGREFARAYEEQIARLGRR